MPIRQKSIRDISDQIIRIRNGSKGNARRQHLADRIGGKYIRNMITAQEGNNGGTTRYRVATKQNGKWVYQRTNSVDTKHSSSTYTNQRAAMLARFRGRDVSSVRNVASARAQAAIARNRGQVLRSMGGASKGTTAG